MNKFLLLLFFCLTASFGFSQDLHLDSAGRVITLPIASTPAGIPLSITIDKPEPQLEALREALLEKMTRTKNNLVEPDYAFNKFYTALWGTTVVDEITTELDAQISYLRAPGNQKFTYKHLPSATQYFDPLFVNWKAKDYYLINKQPFAPAFKLPAGQYYHTEGAYKVDVYYKDPYKHLLTTLYNNTIQAPDIHGLRTMSNADYYRVLPEQLNELKKWAGLLSAVPLELYTDRTIDSIGTLHKTLENNKLYQLVRNSTFFKRWIWLYEGEITINPLEIKASDTASRTKNIALADGIARSTSLLNSVWIPLATAKKRQLVYSAQLLPGAPDQSSELKQVFTTEEEALITVTNIKPGETTGLRETKTAAIKDQNAFMDGVDSVSSLIGLLVTGLNPMLGTWGKIFTAINPLPKVTAGPGHAGLLANEYNYSKAFIVPAINRQQVLNAIEADLKRYGSYNPTLFKKVTTYLEGLNFKAGNVDTEDLQEEFLQKFLIQYEVEFKKFTAAKEQLQTDSLVASNLYRILMRSHLPPQSIQPGYENGRPRFRTERHRTGKEEEAVRRYFSLTKYLKTGEKTTDSSSIASFDYKVGKHYVFLASVGIGFTFPNEWYGQNTVTTEANGTIKTDSKAETIRLLAGLHIYPGKIFLQDNRFLGSEQHPWYTRLSLFAGLGMPKPLQNYYPGISFDPVPGIKLIAGPHLYRHKRFKIENNVITQTTAKVKYAGPYLSLNLDPAVAVKALGFFKK